LADGKAINSRTTSIRSASMEAAKFAALSKLPMSSKDWGIPKRLPYQTRHIVLDVIATTSVILALGREK
jgi:hypothetical protein